MRSVWLLLLLFTSALPAAAPSHVTVQPYVAPILQFEIEEGTPIKGDVLQCVREMEAKGFVEHNDNFVVLLCSHGIRLKLDNLYFDGAKVTIRVESIR